MGKAILSIISNFSILPIILTEVLLEYLQTLTFLAFEKTDCCLTKQLYVLAMTINYQCGFMFFLQIHFIRFPEDVPRIGLNNVTKAIQFKPYSICAN